MIVNEMRPHVAVATGTGTTIHVLTAPYDHRDIFRGEYVNLYYDFSNAKSVGFHNVSQTEQKIFVMMEQEGEVWKATGSSQTQPKEGVFLRGVIKPNSHWIEYGIETYYIQEGTGKAIELENALQRRNRDGMRGIIVELVVASDGKASVKEVHVP